MVTGDKTKCFGSILYIIYDMVIKMPAKMTFEKALVRLEEINNLLEKGELSLDESIKLFEEGSKLSLFCYEKLESAKQKVEEISKER